MCTSARAKQKTTSQFGLHFVVCCPQELDDAGAARDARQHGRTARILTLFVLAYLAQWLAYVVYTIWTYFGEPHWFLVWVCRLDVFHEVSSQSNSFARPLFRESMLLGRNMFTEKRPGQSLTEVCSTAITRDLRYRTILRSSIQAVVVTVNLGGVFNFVSYTFVRRRSGAEGNEDSAASTIRRSQRHVPAVSTVS